MSTTTAAAAAITPLDVARVRRTLATLRDHLAEAVELVEQLWAGRAWVALGLPSWEALCAAELPELGVLLDAAQRRSVVVALRAGGASYRAAAAPVGASVSTAKAWAEEAGVVLELARGTDGKLRRAERSAPAAGRPASPRTDRTVALLAERGPLSVAEVARAQRVGQHIASATLTRLAQAGRVTYTPGARRGVMGTWAAGSVAR